MTIQDYDFVRIVKPLTEWFADHARDLPWRRDPSPYHVWISEIMLQQTRVEAVKAYYERFIAELPDVESLSRCPEDRYLKLWEGLGYYSRVRNLHRAAEQIMDQFQGVIPSDYDTLLQLKGIGHYTAGAIASLAYEKPVPAVDGNVLRVITRLSADESDIGRQSFRSLTEQVLKEVLEQVHPQGASPRAFNQALMELGALVCVPNGAPRCSDCPLKSCCLACRDNLTDKIPVKTKAKSRRIEEKTVLLIRDGRKIAIHKRPDKGLLAGLYEYPNYPGHLTEKEVLNFVRSMGYNPLRIRRLPDSRHVFSHIEWDMIAYHLLVEEEAFSTEEQRKRAAKEQLLFVNSDEQEQLYAVPSAFHAYKPIDIVGI